MKADCAEVCLWRLHFTVRTEVRVFAILASDAEEINTIPSTLPDWFTAEAVMAQGGRLPNVTGSGKVMFSPRCLAHS